MSPAARIAVVASALAGCGLFDIFYDPAKDLFGCAEGNACPAAQTCRPYFRCSNDRLVEGSSICVPNACTSDQECGVVLCFKPQGGGPGHCGCTKDDCASCRADGLCEDDSRVASCLPAVSIVSPIDGETVIVGQDEDLRVPIQFTLRGFGPCAGPPGGSCGTVLLRVEGEGCNNAQGFAVPVNGAGPQSPLEARMAQCANPWGPQTVRLLLASSEGPTGAVLLNADGSSVSAGVTFKVRYPTVQITSPQDGATVSLELNNNASISFSVTGLYVSMQCGLQDCPTYLLTMDGSGCNSASGGTIGIPHNSLSAISPIWGNFGLCQSARGPQIVRLFIWRAAALMKDEDGQTITSSVSITTQ